MRKIVALKDFTNPITRELVKEKQVIEINNNTAHTLIEYGFAKLYIQDSKPVEEKRDYADKMMTPRRNKRGYVTK